MMKMHNNIRREDFKICPICGYSIDLDITATPTGDVDPLAAPDERWQVKIEGNCGGCEAMIMLADYFPTAEKGINTLLAKARTWWNSRPEQGEGKDGEQDD